MSNSFDKIKIITPADFNFVSKRAGENFKFGNHYESSVDHTSIIDAILKLKDDIDEVTLYELYPEINLELSSLYANRAFSLMELGNYLDAFKDLQIATETYKHPALAHCYLVKYYLHFQNYKLALKHSKKSLDMGPIAFDKYVLFFHMGIVNNNLAGKIDRLNLFELACSQMKKAISINPDENSTYLELAKVYLNLKRFPKMELNLDIYLYKSYLKNEIKLSPILFEYWSARPGNIKFISNESLFDPTKIDIKSVNELLKPLSGFNIFHDYNQLTLDKEREKLSNEALFYFYTGCYAGCFVIYNNKFDELELDLNARDLYYYALTAQKLQVDPIEVANFGIHELLASNTLDQEENYYLGQLYLLKGNQKEACKSFNLSKSFIPSLIMLTQMVEDTNSKILIINELLRQDLVYKYTNQNSITYIDLGKDFISNFKTFIYAKEIKSAIEKLVDTYGHLFDKDIIIENRNIWHAFDLSVAHKKELEEGNKILFGKGVLLEIKQNFNIGLSLINERDKVESSKLLENELANKVPEVSDLFSKLRLKAEQGMNMEIQIGLAIENVSLKYKKVYLYLIYYSLIQDEIDRDQTFKLFIYFLYSLSKYNQEAIKNLVSGIATGDFSKLALSYLGIDPLILDVGSIVIACNNFLNDDLLKDLPKASAYVKFKESLEHFIFIEKTSLSEEAFIQKFQCFPEIIASTIEK